jgi:DNA-binding response OmpR family regulator
MIIDIKLPDGSGLDLIRHLRDMPAFQTTVIIVSSASVFAEDQYQSLNAGANDFLPKPVRMPHLLDMLAQHLHLQWSYADPPAYESENAPVSPGVSLAAAHIPPREVLTDLHKLAMMGHAAALQAQAAELARSDERYAPFAAEVERLARTLQMNEACSFLEQYLEQ